jgi:predicted nucleic acid-binding protein
VVKFLLDTNVVSELRKGPKTHAGVSAWFAAVPGAAMYLSVLVLGELTRGIDLVRRRDRRAADGLDRWLEAIMTSHSGRIVGIDARVARRWGSLNVPNPLPAVDGLLAATALEYGMTIVSRNVKDLARTGVPIVNPFLTR